MDLRNFFTPQPTSKRAKLSPTCEAVSNKSSSSSSSADDSDNYKLDRSPRQLLEQRRPRQVALNSLLCLDGDG